VLGSTGNCGTALIQNLLCTKEAKINAYCRSKTKLIQKVPLVNGNERVQIYEGSIYDIDLLSECIRNARAIFHVVSTNDNVPGYNIGLETAKSLISALARLAAESQPDIKLPKIVLLSSSTIDAHLSRHMPWWFKRILLTSASHVYDDLRRTESFLRAQQDWISTIFIKPGGLAIDIQRGHKLNLDHDESFISYLDLSAAMIEAADDPEGIYDMKNVSVTNTNGGAKFPQGTLLCILSGLVRHYFPFLHSYLPSTGPS
jgi:putative NADH-flavin reductase